MMKQVVDKILNKFLSRKLLVWIVSTIAMFFGFLVGGDWMAISIAYIGSQGIADIVAKVKGYKSQE